MPDFQMKVKAPKINKDAVRVALLGQLEKTGKKLAETFDLTTETWEGDKPTFEPKITLNVGSGAGIEMGMTGSGKGQSKWLWLDFGTSVRYAIMSGDWKSKTTPGFVGSGPGGGSVVRIDVNNPQPGIEARGWSVKIKKDFKPIFQEDMQAALADGLAKATKG